MKRVLVIGGIAKSLILFRGPLLRSFMANAYHVYTASGETTRQTLDQLRAMGVHHSTIPIQRTSLNPAADLRTCYRLFHLIRRIRPHVVLFYTIKPVIYGSIAARMARVPKRFAMITGLGTSFRYDRLKGRLLSFLCAFLYRVSLRNKVITATCR